MQAIELPVCDDILTPTIFWPPGQNIVTIYWPINIDVYDTHRHTHTYIYKQLRYCWVLLSVWLMCFIHSQDWTRIGPGPIPVPQGYILTQWSWNYWMHPEIGTNYLWSRAWRTFPLATMSHNIHVSWSGARSQTKQVFIEIGISQHDACGWSGDKQVPVQQQSICWQSWARVSSLTISFCNFIDPSDATWPQRIWTALVQVKWFRWPDPKLTYHQLSRLQMQCWVFYTNRCQINTFINPFTLWTPTQQHF